MSDLGSLTPNDLRNQVFERKVRGYDPDEVASVLEEVASRWEQLLAENLHLGEKSSMLEEQIKKYTDIEQTLRDTLVVARKAAEDEAEAARKEAKLIIESARLEAEGILKQADTQVDGHRRQIEQLRSTRDRLYAELKALLHSYTLLIEKLETAADSGPEPPAREEHPAPGLPEAESEFPLPERPDTSPAHTFDEELETPTQRTPLGPKAREGVDTSDAFDAALNKIFGGGSDEEETDESGSKDEPASGSGG